MEVGKQRWSTGAQRDQVQTKESAPQGSSFRINPADDHRQRRCPLGPRGGLPSHARSTMAQEADDGRALDDIHGGGGAQWTVEGGEAIGRSGPPRRTSVTA